MDEADRAQARMELEEAMRRRAPPPAGPQPTGFCLWCGMVVTDHARWCDADCRDDWERAHVRRV